MNLDVGCGNFPKGTVNCDLFIDSTFHRGKDTAIDKSKTKNLVQCSAEYLPFKDKVFKNSYSKAVLEHVDSPSKVIREMERVTYKRIILIVPHRYLRDKWLSLHYRQHEDKTAHKHFYNERNLRQLIERISKSWFIIYTRNRRPFKLLPVEFPHALYVEMRTDKKSGEYVLPIGKNFIERLSGIDLTWS